MSKIYKVSDIASLPVSGESGVLYLVQVDDAREAYIWDGSAFVPIAPQNKEWIWHSTCGKGAGGAWTVADVSDVYDIASEFMVRMLFWASNNTQGMLETIFPNFDNGAVYVYNHMMGYFYDSSYNASLMMRYDFINKQIYPVVNWSKITGSTDGFVQYEVLYR